VRSRIVFTAIIILVLAGVSPGCKPGQKPAPGVQKIKVVTTLFPLYDFAKNIGGDKVLVSLLLPPGVEPHSFEPKPADIIRINEADIFVYTGKFMEPWAEDVIKGVSNKSLSVVDASKGVKMLPAVSLDREESSAALDPHIWLDFDNGKIMVANIAEALESKDPAGQNFYAQNTQSYDNQLNELDMEFRSSLSDCRSREIVYAGHYAFGYPAARYGLKYAAAQGVSPDSEPTANDLIALIKQIKKNRINYIFYEELTSPRIAQTIADETDAKILLLNAAHNVTRDQFEKGVSFIDIMKSDLANLKTGLECR